MDGTTSSVNSVPMLMPLTSTMPMELRAAAPAPVTSVSGKLPAMVATVVISTGRSRSMAASRMACGFVRPRRWSWLANSTMRMPFLEISPTSVIRPTSE